MEGLRSKKNSFLVAAAAALCSLAACSSAQAQDDAPAACISACSFEFDPTGAFLLNLRTSTVAGEALPFRGMRSPSCSSHLYLEPQHVPFIS